MSGAPPRLLRLSGGPREVGEGHGRAVADLVAHNLDLYFRRFAGELGFSRDEVLRRTERIWPGVRVCSAAFAEMVEGVADGAGQPVMEIAALNLRYELFYGEFSRLARLEMGGREAPGRECTVIAVAPEASRDGHIWIGQNWDWIPGVAGVLVHVTRPDGLRVLAFTEAGIAGGKIGLNSAGVGLAVSGLISDADDWTRPGRPFHLRTWEALCSATLEGAIRAVTQGDRACSANFLLAHAGSAGEGTVIDLQVAPHGECVLSPGRGTLACANHFHDPARLGIWQPITDEWRSTFHRRARAEGLLGAAAALGPIHSDALVAILRDHDGAPESICRHPNPTLPESERFQTGVSMLMDVHAGCALVAPGPPCASQHRTYRV